MFCDTGRKSLQALDLGDKFDTTGVTEMQNMFLWMGEKIQKLDLGDKFDTSSVTNMSGMFWGTGYSRMTSFNLGDKFNTSKVTNMKNMFYDFASNLPTLDLGD